MSTSTAPQRSPVTAPITFYTRTGTIPRASPLESPSPTSGSSSWTRETGSSPPLALWGEICVGGARPWPWGITGPGGHGGCLCPQPHQPLLAGAHLPHRRPGTVRGRGGALLPGTEGLSDQIPGPPHRAGGDRAGGGQGPGVERCICTFEEKRQRLSGFYLGTADPDQVRQTLAQQLPSYMVPSVLRPCETFPSIRTEKWTGKPCWRGGRPHDRPATAPSAPSRNHAAVRL